MPFQAWGDESIRMAADPPMYLLAASIFDSEEPIDVSALERIKPSGAKKLHWMDMNARLRRESLSALGSLPASHTVVVASPLNGRKQERARRKALEALLPRLEQRGIGMLVLESRGRVNDRRDVELLLAMRRRLVVSQAIDITHRKGDEDSRLWVPDQILGALGDHVAGSSAEGWDTLAARIEMVRVDL